LNEEKLKELKERERKLLEKKSEVLRRYLHENVIPILSKGIMEVCKELPNDPVDFLADFLFENSMKVKFPPTKYKDN
jgi:adenylate kinase